MPQPRSTTVEVPNALSRAARWVATESRVACSSPSGVKYIDAARSPNFSTARVRRSAWVSATASSVGRRTGAGSLERGAGPQRVRLGKLAGLLEHSLAVVGQQPLHGLDVHTTPSLALH